MAEKLSDALMELAEKSRGLEEKVTAARQESQEKLHQQIDKAKSDLEAKKVSFVNKSETIEGDIQREMGDLRSSVKERIDYIKSDMAKARHHLQEKMGETKHKWDVVSAERQYENATDYAVSCIQWAYIALSEAESASLEAVAAKLKLDEVKAGTI